MTKQKKTNIKQQMRCNHKEVEAKITLFQVNGFRCLKCGTTSITPKELDKSLKKIHQGCARKEILWQKLVQHHNNKKHKCCIRLPLVVEEKMAALKCSCPTCKVLRQLLKEGKK